MKNLIHALSISLVILFFTACEKYSELKVAEQFEDLGQPSFINDTRAAMQKILPANEFKELNWNAGTIKTPAGGQGTELTVFDGLREKKLIFCEIGKMKMYQWNGEVHLIFEQTVK